VQYLVSPHGGYSLERRSVLVQLQEFYSMARLRWLATQRFGVQLPRVRPNERVKKKHDLAREAVSCNTVLGRRLARAVGLNQDLGRDA
jgi:hypothetical protein